jgi:hypothetical protein
MVWMVLAHGCVKLHPVLPFVSLPTGVCSYRRSPDGALLLQHWTRWVRQLWTIQIGHLKPPTSLQRHILTTTTMNLSWNKHHTSWGEHKNTKGMDACASSYIMYGNVNKRLPVFAISISTWK